MTAEDDFEAAIWTAMNRHHVTTDQPLPFIADILNAAAAYAAGDSETLTAARRALLHHETRTRMKPLLAVDVDGVLNAVSRGEPPDGWRDTRKIGFRIRYNPEHGGQLLAIAAECGAELVWCTTWEDLANQHIRQLVGLPELPWVPMAPGRNGLKFSQHASVGCTKAAALRAYAGTRPFCWLDDEPDAAAELSGHPVPHLVVHVDNDAGLQEHHLAAARTWLRHLASQPEPATPGGTT